MKLVCIADTHGKHHDLTLPEGDVLVHAGDCVGRSTKAQAYDFADWLADSSFDDIILVAGNHDYFLTRGNIHRPDVLRKLDDSITYLQDESTTINGITIYGSPWTPEFNDWAFMDNEDGLAKRFASIPESTDILVTHGPPRGIRDGVPQRQRYPNRPDHSDRPSVTEHVGSTALADAIERVGPDVHVFGHIHEGYGTTEKEGIRYINCSVLDGKYNRANKPIVFEYEAS